MGQSLDISQWLTVIITVVHMFSGTQRLMKISLGDEIKYGNTITGKCSDALLVYYVRVHNVKNQP